MPLPYHLVDGYNLLHAAGLARASYGPGDLERARTGLLVRLADGLDDAERERTTVVFDAADPPPDADRAFRFRGMTVRFSVDEGEADALIEELIRRHPSPRQLRVVSEDIRLQKAAKRRGAQAVKSEAFLDRLRRRAAPVESRGRPARPASEGQGSGVGEWLEFFGVGKEITVADPTAPARKAGAAAAGDQKPADTARPARARRPAIDSPPVRPQSRQGGSEPPDEAGNAAAEGEEFGFWQGRIDELLKDEERRSKPG